MKFYVYCVADDKPRVDGPLAGIDGRSVELFDIEGVTVAASKYENDLVPVTRENVVRHEAVVRTVFSQVTVLPFRFGSLVTEAGLGSFLKSRQRDLSERMTTVRNCVEMSIKIIWQNPSKTEETKPTYPGDREVPGSGTAFLMAKREELLGDKRLEGEAHDIASWLSGSLRPFSRKEQLTVEPKQKLMLAVSYLVERSQLPDYQQELLKLKAQKPELHFLASGPWPPYTFANIDLEFETQFRVS